MSVPSPLRHLAEAAPPLRRVYRTLRDSSQHDPLTRALYTKLFERGRLKLPIIEPEALFAEQAAVELPAFHPLFAGEDTPLNDLLFLLALAKGRGAKRILEIGTYRARTTYALSRNCPDATIVSYDIQVLSSRYREALEGNARVQLRHCGFTADADTLRREPPYDFIFVDGSHRFDIALDDSKLALEIVAPGGIIVWHDYRFNGYTTEELRVPEVLDVIVQTHPVSAVRDTMCAVLLRPSA